MITHTETQRVVEELISRTYSPTGSGLGSIQRPDKLCHEAATLITRQQEEIEHLKNECREYERAYINVMLGQSNREATNGKAS